MQEDCIARSMVSSKPQLHSTSLPTVCDLCLIFNSSWFESLAPMPIILIDYSFFLSHCRCTVGMLPLSAIMPTYFTMNLALT